MPRSGKQQSRLAFTPLPSSSPTTKGYNKQIQERAAAVSIEGSPSSSRKKQSRRNGDSRIIPTPESDSEDDAIIVAAKSQPSKSSSSQRHGRRQERLDFTRSRDPTSFDSSVTLPSSSHAPASSNTGVFNSKRRRTEESASSSDEADNVTSSPRVTRSSQKPAVTIGSDSEDDNLAPRQPQLIEEESEDEDEEDAMPTTLGTQRSRQKRKRAPSVDSFISSPPAAVESGGDDESKDDVPITPPRRRLKRRRQMTQQEEEDLAEDLEFLEPSSDAETSARKPRSSQSAKKTAQQKALERLKCKRSGRPVVDLSDEENDCNDDYVDDDQENGSIGEDGSDDEDVTQLTEPPMSSRQMFAADEGDEDFIEEEDEDNPLGVPDGVPLEFTRYASMKGKELFKFAVEWMVQRKINPAFRMNDEIYDLTFRKLNDEITGLAGSKFTSSAWTPKFLIALKSRPEIAYEPLDRTDPQNFMRTHCDACNRSGHPATCQVQFQGKPYHPTTLDEVGGDDDEDNDDTSSNEDDRPGYDHEGREVPPANHQFYVGKFCMANAETAHSLHHWRLHLYQIVEAYLTSRGYNTSDKIVQRDSWSTRKRRKHANKIVDHMQQEGEIKDLWKKFKEDIDQARNAKLAGRFGTR